MIFLCNDESYSFFLLCGHPGLEFPILFFSVIKVKVANFKMLIMHLQPRSPPGAEHLQY